MAKAGRLSRSNVLPPSCIVSREGVLGIESKLDIFVHMPHRQIIRDIQAGLFKPVYLLHGEEPYFIDEIAKALESSVVEESMRDFNQTILYGRDTNIDQVLEASRRFPMMAERQLVLMREAQDWGAWRRKEDMEKLEAYANAPVGSTVLVFCFKNKKADGRLKAVKAVSRAGVLFLSEKVRDYKLPEWIRAYVAASGLKISAQGAQILAEYLGNDLRKVANELKKLQIVLPAGTEIGPEHIEKHIGISKDYNVFELQRALGSKDLARAHRITDFFAANPKDHPVAMIMPVLNSYFSKIYAFHGLKDRSGPGAAKALRCAPFAVKEYAEAARLYPVDKVGRIFGYLREADRKSKGQGNASTSDSFLLKEAIFKILH
jgi:DNA polymerase-3 subunit delta